MSILDEENQRTVQPRFLDLSGVHVGTKEELQNIMFKMLEVRLRPDKLSDDEVNRIIYCESSSPYAEYPFLDPIPASMKDVNLTELSQVDIDWKMLTLERPNTKQEMEIFSRFVELEKLKLKSLWQEYEKAETRVAAIKVKVEADGFEQETNSDEFTYDYFSRRLAVEEVPPAEDSSKKSEEAERRKLSQKLDSVSRQETFPETVYSTSPVPEAKQELKRKLSVKKKKKKRKIKRLRKKGAKGRKRKRKIKRLKNGRVVYVTIKRRKKWHTLMRRKRKNKTLKSSASKGKTQNVRKSPEPQSTAGKEAVQGESISNEIELSKEDSAAKGEEIRESSARLRRVVGRNRKSTGVSKVSTIAQKGLKTRKINLSTAIRTDAAAPKSRIAGRHINTPKHVKGVSTRAPSKLGTFARSTSIRRTKTVRAARLKITQTSRARKKSTNAKLDANGKGIEPDEIEKEGRTAEKSVPSAKLSSSASGRTKTDVINRRSLKSLIKAANMDSKYTPGSPSEKPSESSKGSNNENGA